MKKRVLSILLCLCIVATLLPTMTIPASAAEGVQVRSENTLRAALANESTNHIFILNDIALESTAPLTVNRSVTIYLSGHKLTGAAGAEAANGTSSDASAGGTVFQVVAGGTLTITDSGTVTGGAGGKANNAYSGGAGGDGVSMTGGSLVVTGGATISGGDGGIGMGTNSYSGGNGGYGIRATGGSLTVTSATIKGGWGGSANGTSAGSSGQAGRGGNGIYTKNIGTFTITDSTIKGGTGGGVASANRSLLIGGEGLRLLDDSSVTLSGSCTVTGGTGGVYNSRSGQGAHAINSTKAVTIDTGSGGTTTITGGNGSGYGINGGGVINVSVIGSGTATITGGDGGAYNNYYPGSGIHGTLTVGAYATVYVSGGYNSTTNPTFQTGVTKAITAESSLIRDSADNSTFSTLSGNTSNKRYVQVLPLYAITKTAGTGGTLTIKVGEDEVDTTTAGQTVKITATPSTNYELEAVTVTKTGDKTTTVTVEDNAFTMPSYPVTVSATFKALFYNAVITAKNDGTAWKDTPAAQVVLSTSNTDAATGQQTVSPVNGVFTFKDIPPSDTLYIWAKNNAGTYVQQGSVTASSTTAAVEYYTVALVNGDGIASVSGAGTYLKGETVTINAELNTNKTWSRWTESAGVLTTTKNYTITGINKAYSLTALAKTDAAITIAAGQSKTYNNTAVTAGTTGDIKYSYTGDATPVVKWYADNSGMRGEAMSAPINAGTYWIGVSAAATDNSTVVTEVFQPLTMEKATVDVTTHVRFDAPSNLEYNGAGKAAAVGVKSGYTGLGTATLYYNTTDAAGTSTTAPIAPGTYYVYARFAAGTNFKAVETPVRVGAFTVNKVDPSVVLTSADTITIYEDEVTLTATVTGVTGGDTPTGTVTFKVGATTLSPVTLDGTGKATLKKSDLNAATYSITAVYNGDGNYNTKISATVSRTVAKRAITFTVSGTDQTYESGTAKTVSITGTGSRLSEADFTVQFYRVDENEDVLASTIPVSRTVAVGRYLYVISFKNAQTNYEIARTYSVGSTALPSIASYDNVGYMDIKAGAADQQKPISFQSGLVSKYVTEGSFTNALTNGNGTTATYQSSNTNVATVSVDGTVTIKAAGSTTITATSTKSGTTPVYASYTLNVSKTPVTVTVQNESVVYGGVSPYTGVAQLTFSLAITAADYNAGGLTFSGYTVGKSVDTYDITVRGLTSEKYAFTYVPGSLTVTQKTLSVSNLTFTAYNKGYNGSTAATGSVAVNSTNLVGSDVLDVSFTASFADADAADAKTVRFTDLFLTGSKADNYTLTATSGEASANITPAPVTVICQSTAVAFDGTAKTAAVSAYVDGILFTHYEVTYKLGEASATTTVPSAVGEYAIGIKLKNVTETNYTVTQPTATLTITDAAQDAFEIVGVPDTVTYGDVPFVLSAQGNTVGSSVTFAVTGGGASASVAGNTVTVLKPGTVTITATSKLDGYKDKTRTVTFTVKKKTVTVVANNQAMTYGDMFSSLPNNYTVSGGDCDEITGTADYTTNYTAVKGAGSYLITPSGLTSDYYTFTYESGALTVGPKTLTADNFHVSVSEKEYDGTTSASFTVTVDTVENDRLTAVYTGGFNAANAAVSVDAICSIIGVTGFKADSYVLVAATIEKNASAKISPMPIKFTFGTTTYLYDTQQKAVAVSAVDSKNRVFSDFTVKYGASTTPPSSVGVYAVTAVLTNDTNYTTSSNTSTLTITEGNVVVWASGGTSQKYDGTAKNITAMSAPNVPTEVTYYAITDEGKVGDSVDALTAVGKYLYVITQTDPNYKIKNEVTVTIGDEVASLIGSNFGILEIAENVQPWLSFGNPLVIKTYGDEAFSETPAGGADGATITYQSRDTDIVTVDSSSGEVTVIKPGLATITATAHKDGFGDVTATYAVQVGKKAVTLSMDAETSVTYKGENWIIPYQLTGDLDGNKLSVLDITFTYTDQSDPNKHTPKNTGTYLAIAQVKADNEFYTSGQATGLLKITPAPLTVTADNKTITYGDSIPAYTVSYTPLGDDPFGCLDGTAAFDCTYRQFDDRGTYLITPSGLSSANYVIAYQPGTLTVNPKTVTLSWSANSLPYNGAAQSVTATVGGLINGDTASVTAYTGNAQTAVSAGYTAQATTLDNGNYTLTGGTNVTHNWSITAVAPALTLSSQTLPNTGNPIAIGAAKVIGVGSDGDMTAQYSVTYTYYTDATRQTQTTAADGAVTGGGAPSQNGTYYVTAEIASQGNYTAAAATATLTLYTPISGGGTGSGSSPSTGAPVIVDGKTVNIGTEKKSGDTTTVTVDQTKLGTNIGGAASGSSVIVPVSENGSATASLVVKNIEDMAAKSMTLTVQTGSVSYNLNTSAIDIAALTAAFPGADMSKVPFDVTIANSSVSVKGETLVLSPVAFTVTATYGGKTVDVDTFSAYIDRVIEVTAEQAAKITTAVVVNADGTIRHVPTNVVQKDGKYYAVVSSRTNSTYALIQNAVTFADAKGKWFEAAVNEMGSRKIIAGRGTSVFDGEASITRAEFAAILVRALGLPADGTSTFSDVPATAWYSGAVATAAQYGIVSGKGENSFDPNASITRQEAMLMLQRAAALTDFSGTSVALDRFADADSVDSWARDAAKWSVGSGLIQGADGKLTPTANITRAESATIILRLLQKGGLVDVRSKA